MRKRNSVRSGSSSLSKRKMNTNPGSTKSQNRQNSVWDGTKKIVKKMEKTDRNSNYYIVDQIICYMNQTMNSNV